jgi:enoyl-CoA hydratase/carnithine racemase
MRSKRIPAKQAMEWGIVTECVADTELEKATDRLVDELRGFSPIAQRTAKKLLDSIKSLTRSFTRPVTRVDGRLHGLQRRAPLCAPREPQ